MSFFPAIPNMRGIDDISPIVTFLNLNTLNFEFFDHENFDFYNVFLMTLNESYFPKLMWVLYNNMCITNDKVIHSDIKKVPIRINQSFFFSLTKLTSQGMSFEGNMVND